MMRLPHQLEYLEIDCGIVGEAEESFPLLLEHLDNGIDLSELSLTNIERIEIVEGPLSTMYGSSAIGGIINIITKPYLKFNDIIL